MDTIGRLSERLRTTPLALVTSCLPECLARCLLSRGSKGRELLEKITGAKLSTLLYDNESEVVKILVLELSGSRSEMAKRAIEVKTKFSWEVQSRPPVVSTVSTLYNGIQPADCTVFLI